MAAGEGSVGECGGGGDGVEGGRGGCCPQGSLLVVASVYAPLGVNSEPGPAITQVHQTSG